MTDKTVGADMKYLKPGFDAGALRGLTNEQLGEVAAEIRAAIIGAVHGNGGHLASNLGVVELTVALGTVFDFNRDKVVLDVGHQCYAHKILTGRLDRINTLRLEGGLSGFPDMTESGCDSFTSGHSSTALSAALGLAAARDIKGQDHHVIAVIGDGSLTGGQSFEALNNAGELSGRLIIVLNDNGMSISKNVGALTRSLTKLRLTRRYRGFKRAVSSTLKAVPLIGKPMLRLTERTRDFFRNMVTEHILFEHFGLKYSGTYDGHNIKELVRAFKLAANADAPVLLHVITEKGKGSRLAQSSPEKFHGVKSGLQPGESVFSKQAGKILTELAANRPEICAITAAMAEGTGLEPFRQALPNRFFDAGIAEAHASTFAGGLAAGGLKPYFAVYSSFMQRAYDQILMDICLNSLPAVLLIDRAGFTGSDGKTHQGIYDPALLMSMPGMTVAVPRDLNSLKEWLEYSAGFDRPLALRYGTCYGGEIEPQGARAPLDKWQTLIEQKCGVHIISYGNAALKICIDGASQSGVFPGVTDARLLKPIDTGLLSALAGSALIIVEESAESCGLFGPVCAYYAKNPQFAPRSIVRIGPGDEFVPHASQLSQLAAAGITAECVAAEVKRLCG